VQKKHRRPAHGGDCPGKMDSASEQSQPDFDGPFELQEAPGAGNELVQGFVNERAEQLDDPPCDPLKITAKITNPANEEQIYESIDVQLKGEVSWGEIDDVGCGWSVGGIVLSAPSPNEETGLTSKPAYLDLDRPSSGQYEGPNTSGKAISLSSSAVAIDFEAWDQADDSFFDSDSVQIDVIPVPRAEILSPENNGTVDAHTNTTLEGRVLDGENPTSYWIINEDVRDTEVAQGGDTNLEEHFGPGEHTVELLVEEPETSRQSTDKITITAVAPPTQVGGYPVVVAPGVHDAGSSHEDGTGHEDGPEQEPLQPEEEQEDYETDFISGKEYARHHAQEPVNSPLSTWQKTRRTGTETLVTF
jgi:hypothetical protein